MNMDISINKPYRSSDTKTIEFDNKFIVTLNNNELEDLFSQIDSEIHSDTREDLLKELEEIKAERDELLLQVDELKENDD
jgi:hypothetical protein